MTKVMLMTLLILMPISCAGLEVPGDGAHGHADLGVVDELGQHDHQDDGQDGGDDGDPSWWRRRAMVTLAERPGMLGIDLGQAAGDVAEPGSAADSSRRWRRS